MCRKQFGKSDVSDITQVILNSYRIPCSRSQGKDNPRGGKCARRGGRQREENIPNGGDRSGEGDNYQPQEEFGSRWAIIIKISGGIRPWMHAIRGNVLSLQVIWIGGNWGTTVPIARRGYVESHDGACDNADMHNQNDIDAYKVSAKDNIVRETRKW